MFPVGPDKAPRVTGGFKAASTDHDQIVRWDWNSGGMIGAVIPDGQIVVDIDPRNGGDATLAALTETVDRPAMPQTKTAKTRSNGTHIYFTVPPELELRGSLGPGIDIKRAGKGYVVVPPSEGYEWIFPGAVAPAPQWLLDELVVERREGAAGEASDPKFFKQFESGTPYGLRAMESELGRLATAQEGGRNHALNKASFALAQLAAGGELDEDAARDALLEVALRIGLEPDEARATILSGWRAGEDAPRQAPEDVSSEPKFPRAGNSAAQATAEAEGRFWNDWEVDEGPLPYHCHPLIPKNAYVMAYGPTEASKSMALAGLLVQGSHHGVRSTIYSLENPPSMDRDRLRRWRPDKANFRLTNEPLDMNDPRQVEALIRREADWGDGRGTDIIMIDTYSHAFSSKSEDGNAKAIAFAVRVRFVMQQVGCSVIIVDHTGYAHDEEPRDASAKRQQVDVSILFGKAGEWRPGSPARFTAKNTKSGRFGNPFFLNGAIHDKTWDDGSKGLELRWSPDEVRWGD